MNFRNRFFQNVFLNNICKCYGKEISYSWRNIRVDAWHVVGTRTDIWYSVPFVIFPRKLSAKVTLGPKAIWFLAIRLNWRLFMCMHRLCKSREPAFAYSVCRKRWILNCHKNIVYFWKKYEVFFSEKKTTLQNIKKIWFPPPNSLTLEHWVNEIPKHTRHHMSYFFLGFQPISGFILLVHVSLDLSHIRKNYTVLNYKIEVSKFALLLFLYRILVIDILFTFLFPLQLFILRSQHKQTPKITKTLSNTKPRW